MKESSRKSPKITLDIKEYEEIIVIDDNTPATSLVSMLRQRAKNEKTRPNSRGKCFCYKWNYFICYEIHFSDSKTASKPPLKKQYTVSLISLDKTDETTDNIREDIQSNLSINTVVDEDDHNEEDEESPDNPFEKVKLWFKERPLTKLFLIMLINGLFSFAMAALIIR